MRRRGEHGRRLNNAERLEIHRRVTAGETFEQAAGAVGCSTKSIQRLLVRTGGLVPRVRPRSPLRLSNSGIPEDCGSLDVQTCNDAAGRWDSHRRQDRRRVLGDRRRDPGPSQPNDVGAIGVHREDFGVTTRVPSNEGDPRAIGRP